MNINTKLTAPAKLLPCIRIQIFNNTSDVGSFECRKTEPRKGNEPRIHRDRNGLGVNRSNPTLAFILRAS